MGKPMRIISRAQKLKKGRGIFNKLISNLPFKVRLPGYQYYGPNMKLQKRLARADQGINPLDAVCKQHDIAYSQRKSLPDRHQADEVENKSWVQVKSKADKFGENIAAWFVTNAMSQKKVRDGVEKA